MTALTYILFGIFGLAVGSFLNVVIVRVPSKESLLSPPSKCPLCQTPIRSSDNIPVISWLLLRGKCRSCGEPIPAGYPLVELTNAVLWVVAAIRFEAVGEAVAFAVFFSILLALSVIDLELSILPDAITLPTALISIPVLAGLALFYGGDDAGHRIARTLIDGVAYAGFLFIVLIAFEIIVRKEGMGFGDVKLALSLGLWLGYATPESIVVAIPIFPLYSLIFASVIGTVVGIIYRLVRGEWGAYPFGPWLALGALTVILAANPLVDRITG
jgi:leader peptidase (prepilin peptidase)/N-methyltransferase